MRYLFISCLFLFSFTSSSSSDGIIGVWLSQIKDGKIEIYKSNGKYHGKVVWIKEPNDENGNPIKDINNPKDNLQSRAIYNLVIIKDLVYEDEKWSGGTVYDPKEGKTYDCSIWLEDGKLKLRGYLGWFYDTKTWTRVK
jgi:uncharacterized protein (DUF2147 family)